MMEKKWKQLWYIGVTLGEMSSWLIALGLQLILPWLQVCIAISELMVASKFESILMKCLG